MEKRDKILLFVGVALVLIVAVVLFVDKSPEESQEEHRLAYYSGLDTGPSQRMNLDFLPERPPGVRLPALKGVTPQFMKWLTPMAESVWLWIALDSSTPAGRYDLLYIDSNGDGHLDDETAAHRNNESTSAPAFGPVKVVFQGEDGPIAYHLKFNYYYPNTCLYAHSAGCYEGDITVAGIKKRIRLTDHNTNGAFNDVFEYPNQGDRIQIARKDGWDSRFVGEYLQLDGALYRPEIARDGAYIKLARAENVELGKVRVPESIKRFSAGGRNGSFVCRPEDGVALLPTGKYGIDRWLTERKDEKGVLWTLRGTQLFNRSMFTVSSSKEAELAIGEPIVYRLEVSKANSGLRFNQVVRGKYGDRINLTCGEDKPKPPKLRIKSKDESYDSSYDFRYG